MLLPCKRSQFLSHHRAWALESWQCRQALGALKEQLARGTVRLSDALEWTVPSEDVWVVVFFELPEDQWSGVTSVLSSPADAQSFHPDRRMPFGPHRSSQKMDASGPSTMPGASARRCSCQKKSFLQCPRLPRDPSPRRRPAGKRQELSHAGGVELAPRPAQRGATPAQAPRMICAAFTSV